MSKEKAVIYVRVSTDRQEYTRQINELLGYAKRHNIEKDFVDSFDTPDKRIPIK